ncbi:MAG: hypothetical protein H0V66_02810 [Bdellovibrionales bacterium]|nr:hypothetical protein [Bdellovibrionales bacterium]
MSKQSHSLQIELEELFDIRNAKVRDEKILTQASMEAQRDIRLITHMFRDGIPDLAIPINAEETVKWDSRNKRLLLVSSVSTQILEGATRQTMIRIRPHLAQLVKQAKEFYRD